MGHSKDVANSLLLALYIALLPVFHYCHDRLVKCCLVVVHELSRTLHGRKESMFTLGGLGFYQINAVCRVCLSPQILLGAN